MKKALIVIALIILLSTVQAIQFGNETLDPQIDSNSFKMMIEPQLDSEMFLQIRLVDENYAALENYHPELKIYDSR